MKALSEPNVTTYHYEYDANGNRTTVEIKDDGLTLESTVYTYDRLNKLVSSREVTASGLYLYEYTYDDNGNLVQEDRHRQFESQRTNIRRYEYTKDNKLESVYSGNILLISYTYDGDGNITSSLERDLELNQNLNINDNNYLNRLTANQRQLINKVSSNDSFLYELTEYITDKNRPYSETLMERDGTGQLSTIYTYGNQRINSESYNNLSGLYTYDGRGSVSAVIGGYGDFRASYWYDGLGNVKSQIHGYGAFGNGKKYYGYNAESYNPVTGNQNLRARQVNIRRQRFLTEDTYLGNKTDTLSINRYIYGNGNPLKYKDPSGFMSDVIMTKASKTGPGISGCGGGSQGLVSSGMILTSSTLLYGPGVDGNIQQTLFRDSIIYGFTNTQTFDQKLLDDRIDEMIKKAIEEQAANDIWWEINYQNRNKSDAELKEGEVKWIDNDVIYNKWYYGDTTTHNPWCSVFVTYNMISGKLTNKDVDGSVIENPTAIFPSFDERNTYNLKSSAGLKSWYKKENRYHSIDEVINGVDGKKYVPKKGDVMINKSINHSGIVIEYDTTNMIVKTIEGNTTKDTTNDNGYAVMVKERELSYFDGFGDNYYIGGNRQ